MLVLSRKVGQELLVGENIRLKIMSIKGQQVSLAIDGPSHVPIDRGEVRARILQNGRRRVLPACPAVPDANSLPH